MFATLSLSSSVGDRTKAAALGSSSVSIRFAVFVRKCVFTVSPSVNMVKNGNDMPTRNTCDLWFLAGWIMFLVHFSCSAMPAVCVCVPCSPTQNSRSDIHCLAHGVLGDVSVLITCNLMIIQWSIRLAIGKKRKRNQTETVSLTRKMSSSSWKRLLLSQFFKFSSLLL